MIVSLFEQNKPGFESVIETANGLGLGSFLITPDMDFMAIFKMALEFSQTITDSDDWVSLGF